MKTHRTPPLDRGIARFTRLLPFLFILFGAGLLIEGEESDDGFHYERNESSLVVSLEAPDGTSMSADYETRTISILVERHEWEIWRNDELGLEEDRNASVMQGSGEPISVSLADTAYGTLTDTSLVADGDGRASTTFQSAGNSGIATVQVNVGDSSATIDFDISAGGMSPETYEENWNFSHTEAILSAGLNLPDPGETLSPGTTKSLEAVVVVESWDVYVSDWGNVRTENHSYAPAEGAAVSWSCENGDGTTTGYGTTDSAGLAQGSFTMGSSDAVARIDVSFASGQSTYATIQFNVASEPPVEPEDWTLERSETFPVLSNLSLDGPAEMSANESRIINGQVLGEVWDLWRSTQNGEDWRYNYSTSLSDHPVQFSVSAGNGSMNEIAVSSGADGWFSATYTMGDSDGVVSVSADGATASVDISFTHVPGGGNEESVWTVTSTSTTESIDSLSVDGPTYDLQAGEVRTVSGVVQRFTSESVQDQFGATDTWTSNGPVESGYPVEAILQSGDGTLGESTLSADATGAFSTTFTMGSQPSRILFRGAGSVESLPIDFTPPAVDDTENWSHSHDERVLTVELFYEGDPAATSGGLANLRAEAKVRNWEIWISNLGNTRKQNENVGTAIGAPVNFEVVTGDLQIESPVTTTDSGGQAFSGIILGSGESLVRATVTFQGVEAQGELYVGGEPWEPGDPQPELLFTLQTLPADPSSGMPARIRAKVDLREQEVWFQPSSGRTEVRREFLSPAGNAEVLLSAGTTGTALVSAALRTGNDGWTETVYSSQNGDWISGVASFAECTASFSLYLPPTADGMGNGDGNGTGNGDVTGDGDGTNSDGGTNGDHNNDPNRSGNQPAPPLPKFGLEGRVHRTEGGGGCFAEHIPGSSGEVVTEQVAVTYRANLKRDLYDAANEKSGEETSYRTGAASDYWEAKRDWEAEYWEVVGEVQFTYATHTWVLPGSEGYDMPAGGSDFYIVGPVYPNYNPDSPVVGGNLAYEEEIRGFWEYLDSILPEYQYDSSVNDIYWTGSVGSMGLDTPVWNEATRTDFGKIPYRAQPVLTAKASFLNADCPITSPIVVPSVQWGEYWLQAQSKLAEGQEVSKTLLLHAKSTNQSDDSVNECWATVKFKITQYDEISKSTPEVTGLNAPFENWIHARPDGCLRLKPPVERGTVNEVSIVPVEFRAKQGRITEGFDPVLDPDDEWPWASVTGGKVADHVEFFCPGAASIPITFEVIEGQSVMTVLTATASGDITPINLSGNAVSVPTKAVLAAKKDGKAVAKLQVCVLPQRELEFSIFRVSDASDPEGTAPQADSPSDAEVTTTLNEVYKQAGIKWKFVGSDTVTVDYDQGTRDGKLSIEERNQLINRVAPWGPQAGWGDGFTFKAILFKSFAQGAYAAKFSSGSMYPGGYTACEYSIPTLVITHEFGHVLDLAAQSDGDHDDGPWPSGLESLMRPGPGTTGGPDANPGKWLRHEDWELANKSAKAFERPN